MKKTLVSFLLIVLFAFAGCQEQESVVESAANTGIKSLQKTAWQYSPQQIWPKSDVAEIHPSTCWVHILWDETFSFSYAGYNFELTQTGSDIIVTNFGISVKINNSEIGVCSKSNSYGLDFVYDGKNMSVNTIISNYSIYSLCHGQYVTVYYPSSAYVAIEEYVAPDAPTGFSLSPSIIRDHNFSQPVTISWSGSTDTDVTGYEIYRKLDTESSFSLIQSINSRTTTSWTDYNVPWSWGSGSDMGAAYYKMRAVDGTHSFYSSFTSTLTSLLIEWAE